MLAILSITAPIFLVIALGFVAVRSGFFARADMRVMGSFVINFALPAMLFKALSQRSFGEAMQMDYLAVYAVGSLIAVASTAALARKWRKRDLQSSSIFGMGSGMSNSAFIGYPVVSQALGPIASVAMALNMLVETLLILPIVMVTADGQKALLACSVSKDAIGRAKAGDVVKHAAAIVGGGGGGRPDFAQAGGSDPSKLDEAVASVFALMG